MARSTPQKIDNSYVYTTGILTVCLVLYYVIFLIVFASLFTHTHPNSNGVVTAPSGFTTLFIMNAVGASISIGLLIAYLINIAKNTRLDGNSKVIWVILLLFLSPFSMIVYWYLQVWRPSQASSG